MNKNKTVKEHYCIVRSHVARDGVTIFEIAGDMEDARFPEGTVWNPATEDWETAYDDGENEEDDLKLADALYECIRHK